MINSRKNLTQEEFLRRCKEIHNNFYNYNLVSFTNTRNYIDIICPEHGKFSQQAKTHLHGHRCPQCGVKSRANILSINNEIFLDRAFKIHGNKYSYPNLNVSGTKSRIDVFCQKHGLFKQIAGSHLNGDGCKKCCNENSTRSFSDYVALVNKIHNNKFTYPDGYFINKNMISIVCNQHGKMIKNKNSHLQGSGCRKCFNLKSSKEKALTTEEFIKRAKEKHGNKYDYSKVIYKNNHERIIIICPVHGEYAQFPGSHLSVVGCEYCAHVKRRLDRKTFIERSNKIHNNKFNYSRVKYEGVGIKVEIICPNHGSFFQAPSKHMNIKDPRGCPACGKFISKKENKWLDYLGIPNDKNHRHVSLKLGSKKIIVDGYVGKTNTVYEFHGDYWHGNPEVYHQKDKNSNCKKTFGELYQKTLDRENLIKSAGFNLITIWEKDFNTLIKNNEESYEQR